MTELSRRVFLTGVGLGAVGLAGCVSAPEGDPGRGPAEHDPQVGDGRYADVVGEAVGSVTMVRTLGDAEGQGSAFVYDSTHLVTNHHVIDGADLIDIQYTENDWTKATVVGSDEYSDLAVLAVEERPTYANPLSFTDSPPGVGQEVLAIGNPLGFDDSVSAGIVSGVNRSLPLPGGFSIANTVQTDAALNPGNSGGPLVDMNGDVVAVISAGAGEGIGFGISSALARRVIPSLIEDGEFRHAYMGIQLDTVVPQSAKANDLRDVAGVTVLQTIEDTPADGVLKGAPETETVDGVTVPVGGDVIIALDDTPIEVAEDLSRYLALETSPGDTIAVTVIRDGEEQTVELTLAARRDFE